MHTISQYNSRLSIDNITVYRYNESGDNMSINEILTNSNMTKYRVAKLSGILKRKFAELKGIVDGELMSEYEVAARRGKFKRMPQWIADEKGLTAEEQDRLETINAVALKASGLKVEQTPEWFEEHKAEQANKSDVKYTSNSISAEQSEAARAELLAVLGY